jgi:hypothetical protein
MAGGMSWTVNWLQFDNAYYKRPYQNSTGRSRRSTASSQGQGQVQGASEDGSRGVRKKRTGSLSSAGSSIHSLTSRPVGSMMLSGSSSSRSVAALESTHLNSPLEGTDARMDAAAAGDIPKDAAMVSPTVPATTEGQTEGLWEGSVGEASCSDSNSNCSTSSHPSKRSNKLSLSPHSSSSSASSELLWLPTDEALFKAPEFRFYFEQYAADQSLFFSDYTLAHRKMSELGALFDPPGGIEF